MNYGTSFHAYDDLYMMILVVSMQLLNCLLAPPTRFKLAHVSMHPHSILAIFCISAAYPFSHPETVASVSTWFIHFTIL